MSVKNLYANNLKEDSNIYCNSITAISASIPSVSFDAIDLTPVAAPPAGSEILWVDSASNALRLDTEYLVGNSTLASVDNSVLRTDGAGNAIQNSGVLISDAAEMTGLVRVDSLAAKVDSLDSLAGGDISVLKDIDASTVEGSFSKVYTSAVEELMSPLGVHIEKSGNVDVNQRIDITTADSLNRPQLWHHISNDADPDNSGAAYAGDGSILRMGASAGRGDSFNQISEGVECYGNSSAGGAMTLTNYSHTYVKPLQLRVANNVGAGSYNSFLVDEASLAFRSAVQGAAGNDELFLDDTAMTARVPLEAPSIMTDTITESTLNAGVTVEGVLIENSAIQFTSPLAEYEEFTQANTVSGIWAAPQAVTIEYTLIGRVVTLSINTALAVANTASVIAIDTMIPARFRPSEAIRTFVGTVDNGSETASPGACWIQSGSGSMTIYASTALGNFSGVGNSGFIPFSISYNT